MPIDLAFVWAAIIAFAVLAYVVMDGFDLGVGILFPFFPDKKDRDVMMNSVAPVWDGNETWLVLGGGGLLAVFPLAYATILPALYMPLIAMLLGLIFRGVAFEYRWRTKRWERVWDVAFAGGSLVAGFCQGIALGALVQGITVVDRAYAGGWWDWLTPFSVATGIALVVGYSLLGTTWLVMKTEGDLAVRARKLALPLAIATVGAMGIFSLWTPWLRPLYLDRWFGFPTMIFSVVVPLLVLGCLYLILKGAAIRQGHPAVPGVSRTVYPRLRRDRNQLLSLHRPDLTDDLGCGCTTGKPVFLACRSSGARANHPSLYGIRLLGVPRQSPA